MNRNAASLAGIALIVVTLMGPDSYWMGFVGVAGAILFLGVGVFGWFIND